MVKPVFMTFCTKCFLGDKKDAFVWLEHLLLHIYVYELTFLSLTFTVVNALNVFARL